MSYVDGFVLVVPKKKIPAYAKMARLAGKVWREHGALEYRECVGTKPGETIVFAYIVYRSRAHRDKVNAKVMADPRLQKMPPDMPFDPKRMAYGGFKTLVAA